MAILATKKGQSKQKGKSPPGETTYGQRLVKGMREVLAIVQGDDTDGLRYTIPDGATPSEVLAIMRTAEKELKARQTARRARLAVAPFSQDELLALRKCLRVSTECLADFLNVSHSLVEAWEDGSRAPKGAALRLLADIRARPDYWRDQLHAGESAQQETPS